MSNQMNNSGRFFDDSEQSKEDDCGDQEPDQDEGGPAGQNSRGSFFRRRQGWDRPEIKFVNLCNSFKGILSDSFYLKNDLKVDCVIIVHANNFAFKIL